MDIEKMKKIDVGEAKRRLLVMAEWLDGVCEENGATLFMSGGTLLGAVRHKGFIPWDDDIDVYLARPDYDRMVEYFKTHNDGKFRLLSHELDKNYLYPYAKLVDSTTLLVEKGGYAGVNMGLYIDIFPIDGLGDSVKEAKRQMRKINKYIILNLALLVEPWRKNTPFLKNFAIACLRVVAKIVGGDKLNGKIKKTATKKRYSDCVYVGEYVDEVGEKRIMNREEIFGGYETMDFEDIKLKAPKGWDKFLKQFYGDYMTLPPEEKRVLTHGYDLYELKEEE